MSKKDIIKELREDRAKRIEELKDTIADHNPEALFADGFDNAILGYSTLLLPTLKPTNLWILIPISMAVRAMAALLTCSHKQIFT